MHTRIANGHNYGERNGGLAFQSKLSPPSMSITSVRGTGITSISSAFATTSTSTVYDLDNKENIHTGTERGSIIGSVECSHQEFRGTMLGSMRPKGSLMYVTEVAVRPGARRCGAGAMLMRGADEVAALRNVESIYLHVDVTNRAACALYEKCGYYYLDKREPIYAQVSWGRTNDIL
jgi:ribosomal protein S18 acetylase RimI-like enzyme